MNNLRVLLSDQPTVDDMLGYKKVAEALASIITNKSTDTPFTIGIFGEWGTGKTSLLKMIEARVQNTKNYHTIWFDPWRYDERRIIQAALIQTILARIDEAKIDNEGFRKQVTELSAKFLGLIAAKVTEIGTYGLVKPLEIFEEAKQIIKPSFENIRAWNEVEQAFSDVVNTVVGKDGRLVIFIDDLDRCLPENAIQVLEAIKLFLAQKNCVFVLGVEKQGIEKAISLRYKDNPQISGVKYLEKVIQLPFFLPIPYPDDIKAYTQKLVQEANIPRTQRVIDEGGGANPRRIKRFINAFTLLRSIALDKNLKEDVLAKIVMIQLQFPNFYQFLRSDHDAINSLIKLYDREEIPESPSRHVYEKYLEETELVDFLIKTRDIKPDIWDPYLRLTTMIDA